MQNFIALLLCFATSPVAHAAKQIALTFDDAPKGTSVFFESVKRTETLITKLKALGVPQVMVFANACRGKRHEHAVQQMKKYTDAGHLIGNHSCSHPRYDTTSFEDYSKDVKLGGEWLAPLMAGHQKFFRYPFLKEGFDEKKRDQMREWLAQNGYRNGMVSVDNDDYQVSFKIQEAHAAGKTKIDFDAVRSLFLDHVLGAVDFYDDLAKKTLGRSPKHVLLLHEMDATVLFIDTLVVELRKRGWEIISPAEAFQDPVYFEAPKNVYAGNGILAQIAFEKTGVQTGYGNFKEFNKELDRILGL